MLIQPTGGKPDEVYCVHRVAIANRVSESDAEQFGATVLALVVGHRGGLSTHYWGRVRGHRKWKS
jgi:hypothetical protein